MAPLKRQTHSHRRAFFAPAFFIALLVFFVAFLVDPGAFAFADDLATFFAGLAAAFFVAFLVVFFAAFFVASLPAFLAVFFTGASLRAGLLAG